MCDKPLLGEKATQREDGRTVPFSTSTLTTHCETCTAGRAVLSVGSEFQSVLAVSQARTENYLDGSRQHPHPGPTIRSHETCCLWQMKVLS